MSAIPDDISKTAASVWATLPAESAGITAIARAILAERQRCADVARASFRHGMDGQACRWILTAIEAGQA